MEACIGVWALGFEFDVRTEGKILTIFHVVGECTWEMLSDLAGVSRRRRCHRGLPRHDRRGVRGRRITTVPVPRSGCTPRPSSPGDDGRNTQQNAPQRQTTKAALIKGNVWGAGGEYFTCGR